MARLYSDLLDGTARRYYFGLNSAPGGITNASPATLIIGGYAATFQEQTTIFRNPGTAALTLMGLSLAAEPHLQPAPAALAMSGPLAAEQRVQVITNALVPDYTDVPETPPTTFLILTISPTPGALSLNYPPTNLTQGGNIGFVSPGRAALNVLGYSANMPRFSEIGSLTLTGLLPTITTALVIEPETGVLICNGLAARISTVFAWVDDDPVPPTTWIDDAAA